MLNKFFLILTLVLLVSSVAVMAHADHEEEDEETTDLTWVIVGVVTGLLVAGVIVWTLKRKKF